VCRADIVWCERDGPLVRPPERHGFGSNLMQKTLGSQSGIAVRQEFRPKGVKCGISLPVEPDQ
jgi:two-component sensor histidine kinase